MIEPIDIMPGLDAGVLRPIVRAAVADPAAVLEDGWSCHRLGGGGGASLGVYRIAGHVQSRGDVQSWALVVKHFPAAGTASPTAWVYPPREALAYRSGRLPVLPERLAVPRFFDVTERPDGTAWVWLEAITDARPGPWPLARHAVAARHWGAFNGAALAGGLPPPPWLAPGALRALVESAGPAIADLPRLTAPGTPALVRQFFAPPVVAALQQLWAEREALLSAMERLPQALCHRDGHRRNLFSRMGPDGTEQTVAIDWEFAGHGALGEDAAGLVMGNLLFFEAAGTAPRELDTTCFTAYVEGLREAGWAGDPRAVRLGYAVAAVMRYVGVAPGAAVGLGEPAAHPGMARGFGRPVPEVVAAWEGEIWPFLLGLAEEARSLLRAFGSSGWPG